MSNHEIIREAFTSCQPIVVFHGNVGDVFGEDDLLLQEYLLSIGEENGWDVEYMDAAFQYPPFKDANSDDDPHYKYRQCDEACANRAAVDENLCNASERIKALIIRLDGVASGQSRAAFLRNLIAFRFPLVSPNKLILICDTADLEYMANAKSATFIVSIEKPDNEYLKQYVTRALNRKLKEDQLSEIVRLSFGRYQREVRNYITYLHTNSGNGAAYDKIVTVMRRDPVCSDIDTKLSYDDVIGLEEAKDAFYRTMELPIKQEQDFKKFNIKLSGGVLLYGLPGTGKTYLVKAIANTYNAAFYYIKLSDILSMWFGDTEARIREVFEVAKRQKRAIIFLDEIDSITPNRASATDVMQRVEAQLLTEIQGAGSNVTVVGASNRPWLIDSAFLRSQRFTTRLYVPLPVKENRKKLLQRLVGVNGQDIDYDALADKTEGFNNADISALYEEAAINACVAKKFRDGAAVLLMEDFVKALTKIHSTVRKQDIEEMRQNMKSVFGADLPHL